MTFSPIFIDFCILTLALIVMVKGCFYVQLKYTQLLIAVGGRPLLMIPASFSVPVHEISHYLVAKICLHKVNKLVLFQLNNDATLGYLEHAYKPSLISPFTNMLIGIAPLFGGLTVCIGLLYHFYPDSLLLAIESGKDGAVTGLSMDFLEVIKALYLANSRDWFFWILMFVVVNIWVFSLPSPQDFKGAMKGIVLTLSILLVLAYFDTSGAFIEAIVTVLSVAIMPVMITSLILLTPIITFLTLILLLRKYVLNWRD
jgi:hypothetical protein